MASGPTIGWMESEPAPRDIFRLLIGCLTTLSFCVSTTLHLNVPERGSSKNFNKVRWILLGMFAPELVVFTAWSQWMSAKKLTEIINRHLDRNSEDVTTKKKVEWTMTHSYFAQMGGFAFETDDPVEDRYIPNASRLYLTAHGVAILAEMGHLPAISKSFILDKSKADSLAKTLVVVQAGWLIIQCTARFAAHLPLTFLELNTLAHVACALVVYFLWWDKPFDIRDPVLLSGPWVRPVAATMWMFSHISTETEDEGKATLIMFPEIESLVHLERHPIQTNNDVHADSPLHTSPQTTGAHLPNDSLAIINLPYGTKSLQSVRPAQTSEITIGPDQVLLPFGFGPKSSSRRFRKRNVSKSKLPRYYTPPVRVYLNVSTLSRWRFASQCLRDYPEIWSRYRREMRSAYTVYNNNVPVEIRTVYNYPKKLCKATFVDPRIPNWPGRELIQHQRPYLSVLFFSACVLVYGGLHAAAWNDYFPTNTERILWRMSVLYIACSGAIYVVIKITASVTSWIRKVFGLDERIGSNDGFFCGCLGCLRVILDALLVVIETMVFTVVMCVYIVARTFIVVEAFISLRDLPVAVYQTPRWTQYFSHL